MRKRFTNFIFDLFLYLYSYDQSIIILIKQLFIFFKLY
jgi:hypothetical protein